MYTIKSVKKSTTMTAKKDISQNIENFHETSKIIRFLNTNDNEAIRESKPIVRNNSKRSSKRRRKEEITPHHEDLIKYVHDSWLIASSTASGKQCTPSPSSENRSNTPTTLYYEDGPRQHLKDFEPFQLELWWGKRLYNSLTKPT